MKRITFFVFTAFVVFSFGSCKKETNNSVQPSEKNLADVEEIDQSQTETPASPEKSSESPFDFSLAPQTISNSAFHTDAHAQFLNDPLVFSPIPDQGISGGRTAVVGSRVCMLYPKEAFVFTGENSAKIDESISDKNSGIEVPFSSIVQITGERLQNGDENRNPYANGMFEFQSNWNWFYPVTWNGNEGYIFGADLFGLEASLENNKISAELYRTGGKYDEFYPITGYDPLEESVAARLEESKLALQKTKPSRRVYSDDMIDEYQGIRNKNKIPIFITTDLAAHCQHLIFDRLLQFTEEEYFLPRMKNLTEQFISALEKRTDAPEKIREKAIQYFQVPELIMKTAPEKINDPSDWQNPIRYKERAADFIESALAEYANPVKTDYKNVISASGRVSSAIFEYEEDFSQFKPRGHYTKNPLLETYFRAQMWYGRIHFLIADSKANENTPVALLIADTIQKNPDLYKEWASLFDPITSLIGMSDDLSFYEILPLWKDENVSDFSAWANDKDKILSFMKLCQEKLRPPAVNGNSVFFSGLYDLSDYYASGSAKDLPTKAPMGWRLFGQRFTYDSYIHDQVSPPRLRSRDIVRGLDIMKVFGSQTAELLLAHSDYPSMVGLKETLDELQGAFNSFGDDFWNQTYYNQVLYQVKTLANFEQGAGFYFTETPAWNFKAMLSAHGTWAELRHDTILYVKQSAAERAGDGDFEPTFRTEPLPNPTHYVEPNIPFWQASLNSVLNLQKIYATYDLVDDETKNTLTNLAETYEKILEICQKEAENTPITAQENNWIPTIISRFGQLIFVHTPNADYFPDPDQLKMACIADIFTNYELYVCLEVGVANPHKIFVPLNDSQGGKRIAVGFCFSYYEFKNPYNKRLTDEEWKKMMYNSHTKTEDYMPFWEKECLLD